MRGLVTERGSESVDRNVWAIQMKVEPVTLHVLVRWMGHAGSANQTEAATRLDLFLKSFSASVSDRASGFSTADRIFWP
jgi:hypothetical protein